MGLRSLTESSHSGTAQWALLIHRLSIHRFQYLKILSFSWKASEDLPEATRSQFQFGLCQPLPGSSGGVLKPSSLQISLYTEFSIHRGSWSGSLADNEGPQCQLFTKVLNITRKGEKKMKGGNSYEVPRVTAVHVWVLLSISTLNSIHIRSQLKLVLPQQ